MKGLTLPPKLEELVSGLPFREENIGLSGSQVLIYDDFVLKTGPEAPDALSEARLLSWLEGKLPAPKCLWFSTENGRTYLLMTRVKGKMACSEEFMSNPQKLIYTLSQGLRLLWNTDVSNCPVKAGLDEKLASAAARVEAGLVSTLDAEEGTYGPGGFASPEALLRWLEANRPEEDPVFSHGDFCLPNVMLNENGIAGFIDIGRGGICDRWNDIAICRRSLIHNYVGKYASKTYAGFREDMIFDALGIKKDDEKLRYYVLLDELA